MQRLTEIFTLAAAPDDSSAEDASGAHLMAPIP